MSTLFDDPSGGTMEPVIVTRGEVDNTEEKGVSGFDASSRGASSTFHSGTGPHLSRDFGGFEQALSEILGVCYGCVGCLAKAEGRTVSILRSVVGTGSRVSGSLRNRVGGTYQLRQAVLDSVDISELAVEHNLMISIGEGNPCAGRGPGGLDTEEGVQRVGDSLDLFDLEVLDGTKVKDGPVCGTDLEESKGHEISHATEVIQRRTIEGVRRQAKSHGRAGD
jgi:hypothetical protein